MILGHETHHGDWTIYSTCSENKSEDWKPGDPIPFMGFVTGEPGGKSAHLYRKQRIPATEARSFDSYTECHDVLRNEMRALIDEIVK